jgi:tetratricopeptide (TPR) repeat protein
MTAAAIRLLIVAMIAGAGAAHAQRTTMTLQGETLAVTQAELAGLSDLSRALTQSRGFQERALHAAERVARSADARYVLALYQLEIARQRQDDDLRARALDVLIADGRTARPRLSGYLSMRGGIAFRKSDFAAAVRDWARAAELQPGDPQHLVNLAQARHALNDSAGAIALIRRAIDLQRATNGSTSETLYRQWLSIAFNGRLRDETVAAAYALVAAHPSSENWRTALSAYRQLVDPQGEAEIQLMHLMSAVGALVRPDAYQRFSQLLLRTGAVAEARTVLLEGIDRGVVSRDQFPTPDILREIERAAASQRNGPAAVRQADETATRMAEAVAHAVAGRRADAAAGFAHVARTRGGAHAEIARFWLSWLGQPGP